MPDATQLILKKLDDIDSRLKQLEGEGSKHAVKSSVPQEDKKAEKDPLFSKAIEIAQKRNELPASVLQELLNIDQKRAESLIDQLVDAGLGTSYWGVA